MPLVEAGAGGDEEDEEIAWVVCESEHVVVVWVPWVPGVDYLTGWRMRSDAAGAGVDPRFGATG